MVALLDREGVSLPLPCGIAELSHDASGSPSRRALSSCSAEGFLFSSSDHFQPHPPILKSPSWISFHRSLSFHDFALCSLPVLIHAINNGAHISMQPSLGQTPPTQLITACCRWQTLELCVGLLHPPGILLPSHCPPANGTTKTRLHPS